MRYTTLLLAGSLALGAYSVARTTGVFRSHTPPLHGTLLATNMNDNTVTVLDLASRRTLSATRDASGWVVFQSASDDVASEDPVALLDEERARRTRETSGSE